MVQPLNNQSLTIGLTHDPVQIGQYTLSYWEGVRGFPIQAHLTVGTGPTVAALNNITLELQFQYMFSGPQAFMYSSVDPITIQALTNAAPFVVPPLALTPIYPGLAQLSIKAKVNAVPVQIHSLRGIGVEFKTWFYIVEKEQALTVALMLAQPQQGGQRQ